MQPREPVVRGAPLARFSTLESGCYVATRVAALLALAQRMGELVERDRALLKARLRLMIEAVVVRDGVVEEIVFY